MEDILRTLLVPIMMGMILAYMCYSIGALSADKKSTFECRHDAEKRKSSETLQT